MSPTAPDPDTDPQAHGLRQFKQFIYDNYHDTHGIFGDETESAWDARFRGHVSILRLMLPSNKTARFWISVAATGCCWQWRNRSGTATSPGSISKTLLQKAAKRSSAKLNHGDGLEFLKSNPEGAFEAVIAFDIFEHLTRPELLAICREIARTLKPGGRLIVRVPNGCSPVYGQLLWSDITHERPFTKGSLSQLLRPLGFEDIEAFEWAPVVAQGLKSGIHAVLWHIFRAMTVLRIALETGRLHGHILTLNLHLIARKGPAAAAP